MPTLEAEQMDSLDVITEPLVITDMCKRLIIVINNTFPFCQFFKINNHQHLALTFPLIIYNKVLSGFIL